MPTTSPNISARDDAAAWGGDIQEPENDTEVALTAPAGDSSFNSLISEIEHLEADLIRTKQLLKSARSATHKVRIRLFGFVVARRRRQKGQILRPQGETALAEMVLAAQRRFENERAYAVPRNKTTRVTVSN